MRLYSYRGVSYIIAPPSLSSKLNPAEHSSAEQSLEKGPEQSIEQDVFTTLPQTQTPTAAIPMMYRGVLYLLERFYTPCSSSNETFIDAFSDESIESTESADE